MKDGGPAYPMEWYLPDGMPSQQTGMTMRQYYKAATLTGLLAGSTDWKMGKEKVRDMNQYIGMASQFADAMIAEDEQHAGSTRKGES